MKKITQNRINRIEKYNKLIIELHNKLLIKKAITSTELNNLIKAYQCSSTTGLILKKSGLIKKENDKLIYWNTIKPIPKMGKKILDELGKYNRKYWKTKPPRNKNKQKDFRPQFIIESEEKPRKKLPAKKEKLQELPLAKSKYVSILWGLYVKKVYY